MSSSGGLMMIISSVLSLLCLFCSLAVICKILHKIWWTPNSIQKLMASQEITGPPYRLIHGNTKEISNMCKEAMSRPLSLSHDIFSYVQPHVHSWSNIYGKNYLQWLGCQAQLIIQEPEMCKQILNNKDGAYPKKPAEDHAKQVSQYSIVTANGERWAKLRKISTHAFLGESLKTMTPDMIAAAEIMLKRWESHVGKEIEVVEEFRLFTSEVVARTAFGSSYLEGQHIFQELMKLALLVYKSSLKMKVPGISKLFKTNDEIETAKLDNGIRDSIMKIVKEREEKAASGGEDSSFGCDFLGLLLKAVHDADEKQRISVDELVDECKTIYFSGQQSTTDLLSWTVLLLAIHTDWQEEARKEVLELFGKQNPNPDGISKLKTMNMIINETLRLYPPVVALVRKPGTEVTLGKLTVPAGVQLVMSILALHHEPQFWGPDVHLFKPERFLEGVTKATNNNRGAFIPFGLGPRTCVGSNYTTTEAKIALSMILQRYSFTLSPGYVHSPFLAFTVRPQHGVQVMLQPL